MDWGDIVTRTAAAVGACLGLVNTWHTWRQRTVRLEVIPTTMEVKRTVSTDIAGGKIEKTVCSPAVSIVNLSPFPITLEEIGYELKNHAPHSLSRVGLPGRVSGGMWIPDKLPQRLESHASLKVAWWDEDEKALKGKCIRRAYAKTVCGTTVRGKNSLLNSVAGRLVKGEDVMAVVE